MILLDFHLLSYLSDFPNGLSLEEKMRKEKKKKKNHEARLNCRIIKEIRRNEDLWLEATKERT